MPRWMPPELDARGRRPVPLRERRLDIVFIGFFLVNLAFITYVVDLEQLVISDPEHYQNPIWPPPFLVDLVHWYGRNYDPLLMARPAFWRMTIWIDVLAFGPFYAFAIYAFVKGRDWIRLPAVMWAGTMVANVSIIMLEEWHGEYQTSHLPLVAALNLPWFLFPFVVVWRVGGSAHPFTRPDP